jgi:hypothetical protein
MNIVRKQSSQVSQEKLISSLGHFIVLLKTQEEDEAIELLNNILFEIKSSHVKKESLEQIIEAFIGEEQNLIVYTYPSKKESTWSIKDDLYVASTEVLNLARRILRSAK